MRSYPCNSPHAAARLVALAALADGYFSRSELGALDQLDLDARLGIPRQQLYEVVQHLSEDLMSTAHPHWGSACELDPGILHSLMGEVTDPALRRTTLELCAAVTQADFHVADAEQSFISTAAHRWCIEDPMAQPAR